MVFHPFHVCLFVFVCFLLFFNLSHIDKISIFTRVDGLEVNPCVLTGSFLVGIRHGNGYKLRFFSKADIFKICNCNYERKLVNSLNFRKENT